MNLRKMKNEYVEELVADGPWENTGPSHYTRDTGEVVTKESSRWVAIVDGERKYYRTRCAAIDSVEFNYRNN